MRPLSEARDPNLSHKSPTRHFRPGTVPVQGSDSIKLNLDDITMRTPVVARRYKAGTLPEIFAVHDASTKTPNSSLRARIRSSSLAIVLITVVTDPMCSLTSLPNNTFRYRISSPRSETPPPADAAWPSSRTNVLTHKTLVQKKPLGSGLFEITNDASWKSRKKYSSSEKVYKILQS